MGVNEEIKKKRKEMDPNIKGDPSLNVRTDEEGTSDVPATKQNAISPKETKDRDPSRPEGHKN